MAAAGPDRAAALGFSLALLAGRALLPAAAFGATPDSPEGPGGAGADTILFLQSERAEDPWTRELETALDEASLARAFLVVECPAGDPAAVESCLDGFRPRLLVVRRPPSEATAAAIRSRALPLVVAPPSARDAARTILARDGAGAPSPISPVERAAAYGRAARAHFEFGDDAGAKANLLRSLALAPNGFDDLRLLFRAELRGVWLRDAELYAARAAAIPGLSDSRRAAALTGRARARALLGDADGAEKDLREALRLDPAGAEAAFRLAQLTRERPQEALPFAEAAARGAGDDGRRAAALRLAAMIRLDLGDEAGAVKALESAPPASGDELDALQAFVRLERARPREAAAVAERAVRQAGKSPLWERPAAYRLCARLWLELKDYPKALASLKRALALAPDDLYALEQMVQIKRERPDDPLDFAVPSSSAAASVDGAWTEEALGLALRSNPEDLDALGRSIELERGRKNIPGELRFAARFTDAAREASAWRQPAAYGFITRIWDELGGDTNVQITLGLARDLDRRSLEFEELALRVRSPDTRGAIYVSNRVAAYVAISQARAELGDEAGAETALRSAFAQDPEAPPALRAAARFRLAHGRTLEALGYADRLIAASRRSSPAEREADERQRAEIQLALGDRAGAVQSLERALELLPGDLEALRLMIRTELALDRPRRALPYADRLLDATQKESISMRADARLQRAQILIALKDEAGAEKSLEGALALVPENLAALKTLTELRLAQGRRRDALAYAQRVVAASANSPAAERADASRRKARVQLALQDVDGARISLEEALALDADPRPGLAVLLRLELDHGRPREALAYADRLVEAYGKASPAERAADERQRARIRLALGDEARAVKDLERALALAPQDRETLALLVRLPPASGREREALAYADRLVDASTAAPRAEQAEARRERAKIRLELKDDAGAREDFERVLELAPDDLPTLWILIAGDRGRTREAMELVKRHRPADARLEAPWRVLRGMASAMRGDDAAARGDFDAAVKLDSAAVCFGEISRNERDRFDPLFFDGCLRAFPRDPGLYLDRGVARYRAGRPGEAEADFRKVVELKPDFLEARLSLATILAERGRPDEAAAEADRALALASDRGNPVYEQLRTFRESLRDAERSKPAPPPR